MTFGEEAAALSGVFIGIGGMVLLLVVAYMFYQFTRFWKAIADYETKWELLKEILLVKYANKKGIDLDKEIIKKDIFQRNKKTFKDIVQQEIMDDFLKK